MPSAQAAETHDLQDLGEARGHALQEVVDASPGHPVDRGRVPAGLEVVGDGSSFPNRLRDGSLQAVGRINLPEVAEHHYSREHHGHRIDLVLAGVLGSAPVGGLKDGDLVTQVCSRGQAQTADQPRSEV